MLDTQWSPSYANIYRVTGMQFFVIIVLHHTSFLWTCNSEMSSERVSWVPLWERSNQTNEEGWCPVENAPLTWMDKKVVHVAGTYTQAPAQQLPEVNRKQWDGTIQKVACPELVSSFNEYMGGVDKNDHMKSYYPIPVAEKKWWSRVFFDLIDRSIYNRFVFEQESPHHGKRSQKLFRIDFAKHQFLMSIHLLDMLKDISLTFSS